MLVLRSGGVEDVQAMYALDVICFEEVFRFDLRSMRRFAAARGAISVIAEEAGSMTGFVLFNVHRVAGLRIAYVVTLDVLPEKRRGGVAQLLMAEAERRALDAGVEWAALHVHADNVGAIRFYERCGYEKVAVHPDFYGEGLNGWEYRKSLGLGADLTRRA